MWEILKKRGEVRRLASLAKADPNPKAEFCRSNSSNASFTGHWYTVSKDFSRQQTICISAVDNYSFRQ
jgi:hypothetical protein